MKNIIQLSQVKEDKSRSAILATFILSKGRAIFL